MTKICEECGRKFTPKYDLDKLCEICFDREQDEEDDDDEMDEEESEKSEDKE